MQLSRVGVSGASLKPCPKPTHSCKTFRTSPVFGRAFLPVGRPSHTSLPLLPASPSLSLPSLAILTGSPTLGSSALSLPRRGTAHLPAPSLH